MGKPTIDRFPITTNKFDNLQKGLTICAYHEAGHAVIAVLRGIKIDYVQLGLMMGNVKAYERIGANQDLDDTVACILAGDFAVFMLTGVKKSSLISDDKMLLFECFDRLYPGEGWSDRKRDHLHRITREMHVEMKEAWPAVEAVASELLRMRWLRGSECKQIVKNALKSKPIQTMLLSEPSA